MSLEQLFNNFRTYGGERREVVQTSQYEWTESTRIDETSTRVEEINYQTSEAVSTAAEPAVEHVEFLAVVKKKKDVSRKNLSRSDSTDGQRGSLESSAWDDETGNLKLDGKSVSKDGNGENRKKNRRKSKQRDQMTLNEQRVLLESSNGGLTVLAAADPSSGQGNIYQMKQEFNAENVSKLEERGGRNLTDENFRFVESQVAADGDGDEQSCTRCTVLAAEIHALEEQLEISRLSLDVARRSNLNREETQGEWRELQEDETEIEASILSLML